MAATYATRPISPAPGSLVVASDGKELGYVKLVEGDYVKVDARFARDYWLSFEEILSADADKTLLIIPSDEINLYKLKRPHASDLEVGDRAASTDWLDREIMRGR